jgi:hypothetical protein
MYGLADAPVTLPPGVVATSTVPDPLSIGQAVPSLSPFGFETQIYITSGVTIPFWGVLAGIGALGLLLFGGRH